MTLPDRVGLMVERSLALLHPCVYAELGAADPTPAIATGLEKEVRLLCHGRDAAEIVRAFVAALPEVKRLVETDVEAAYVSPNTHRGMSLPVLSGVFSKAFGGRSSRGCSDPL